jgi:farnesyl-diphosphate farnesyltransferase
MDLTSHSLGIAAPSRNSARAYLDAQMNKVSRSFAVVVDSLEEPLRSHLSTAYLLCRVADNIEDCIQPDVWKEERFAELALLLATPSAAGAVLRGWDRLRWPGLSLDECALMGRRAGTDLWRIYAAIPAVQREIIAGRVQEMATGMRLLGKPGTAPVFVNHGGVQVLALPEDYNRYCYIVAGTVGHMGSALAVHHYGLESEVASRLEAGAEACGRALQKTNIVKDFPEDLKRGVSYLPAEWLAQTEFAPLELRGGTPAFLHAVLLDVLEELQSSLDYVLALPVAAAGYRKASLLAYLPAFETNLLAASVWPTLFTPRHDYKISRATLAECIVTAGKIFGEDEQIAALSRRYAQRIRHALPEG